VDPKILLDLGVPQSEIAGFTVFSGAGCGACNDIGYKGRLAIYEVMPVTETLKSLVYQNASPSDIKRQAVKEGMCTLRMSGIRKLKAGLTTVQEVLDNSTKDHA
jgi:type IV pilus assembly protein PilB